MINQPEPHLKKFTTLLIQKTLLYGVVLSSIFLASGIALLLAHRKNLVWEHLWLFRHGIGVEPRDLLQWGLLILMFTPVVRVLMASIGFALDKRWRFVAVSLGVLMILMLSFFSNIK
ncbi:MAG: DUF1634 domain-containing protein [candidate division KSB1 bacterium]|nr:DUF1634 domain-containing protein [candidate division KSB1 bacterium]